MLLSREEVISGVKKVSFSSGGCFEAGSYVVSQDIYWFETIYGKCLHKGTNQRSNHYMCRGGGGSPVTPRILVEAAAFLSRVKTIAGAPKLPTGGDWAYGKEELVHSFAWPCKIGKLYHLASMNDCGKIDLAVPKKTTVAALLKTNTIIHCTEINYQLSIYKVA